MYAALWDREEQVFYLVRDRIGEKPPTTATNMVFFFLVLNYSPKMHPAFEGEVDWNAITLQLVKGISDTLFDL